MIRAGRRSPYTTKLVYPVELAEDPRAITVDECRHIVVRPVEWPRNFDTVRTHAEA